MTSLKGPADPIYLDAAAVHPERPDPRQLPTVLETLPIPKFFLNSLIVAVAVGLLNVLVAAMAAYPLAKMRFRGRERDLLPAARDADRARAADLHPELHPGGQRLPLLRHAARADLPEPRERLQHLPAAPGVPGRARTTSPTPRASTARGSGGSGGQILLPIVRPSLAAVAIFTFVTSWNDFLWPSLMLHTQEGMTLPVGLAALQSFFQSDFRSIAAGVTMTVVPILLFFIVVQRYFVRGLAGAVKG